IRSALGLRGKGRAGGGDGDGPRSGGDSAVARRSWDRDLRARRLSRPRWLVRPAAGAADAGAGTERGGRCVPARRVPFWRGGAPAVLRRREADMQALVGGIRMHWREAGHGPRTVVFIHGFPFDGSLWDDQLDRMPRRWRLLAPDLRGFGRSQMGPVEGPLTMER